MRKHCTGERRDIRDTAVRGIGFVFADNLEALFAPILPAQGDRRSERGLSFILWSFDDLGSRAPRLPVGDFPQSRAGRLAVALFLRDTLRRFEPVQSGLNGSKPRFGYEIAVGRYRPVGESDRIVVGFPDERAGSSLVTDLAPILAST